MILDIGAHIGTDTMSALVSNDISTVFSIDANAAALLINADNVIRNHFAARVQFLESFIGDFDHGTIPFWSNGSGAAGSRYREFVPSITNASKPLNVPCMTVDGICRRFNIEPDFIKIDVEGAEIEVLRGAADLMKKAQSRFLIEMHSGPGLSMLDNLNNLIKICKPLNYEVWYLAHHAKLEDPKSIAHRGRCHLMLQPADWPYPDFLQQFSQCSQIPNSSY